MLTASAARKPDTKKGPSQAGSFPDPERGFSRFWLNFTCFRPAFAGARKWGGDRRPCDNPSGR
jgi:hypothetical protein